MSMHGLTRGFAVVIFTATVIGLGTLPSGDSRLQAGKPSQDPPVKFDVTTTPESAGGLEIVGVFDPDFGDPALEYLILGVPAEGRAGKTNVVVNRPSPAVRMDFLTALSAEHFPVGTIYGGVNSGTIDIRLQNKGPDTMLYFFPGPGKNGQELLYLLEGDAVIEGIADPNSSFPKGDPLGYIIEVNNFRLSGSSGSRKNAYEGEFPEAGSMIVLERQVP